MTRIRFLSILVLTGAVSAQSLVCGDCDADGASPTILDALAAARFSLPSWMPTPAQECACDVDSSGALTVLDALRIAQAAAGVPVSLGCPAGACVLLVSSRVVDRLGTTATGPVGVNPAYAIENGGPGVPPVSGDINDTAGWVSARWWDFDYLGLNEGAFDDRSARLTDAGGANVGNPVVLFSAGHDYSGIHVDPIGPCNPVDTFQLVLEATVRSPGGEILLDLAPASSAFLSANLTTTWLSSDPGVVSVSPDGLLTATAENGCVTVTAQVASDRPDLITIGLGGQPRPFLACVDAAGVDTSTRQTWLPVGDVDCNVPGSPSGPPVPAVGGGMSFTFVVNSGTAGVGAYASRVYYDEAYIQRDRALDSNGVGGSTQPGLGPVFASGCSCIGEAAWIDVDAFASTSGIFDLSTFHVDTTGPGTSSLTYRNVELADGQACNIWVTNPCMPGNSYVCPTPPPAGGYFAIAPAGPFTVP